MKPFLKTPIAHRGLHFGSTIPENSLAAFQNAIASGFPIEMDVQITRDGVPIVFHDDDCVRLTGFTGKMREQLFDSVKNLRLLGGLEKVPTLQDALDCIGGQVPVLLEIKNLGNAGRVEDAIWNVAQEYLKKIPSAALAFQSFNPKSMHRMRLLAPQQPRGIIVSDFSGEKWLKSYEKFILRKIILAPWVRPNFLTVEQKILKEAPYPWFKKMGIPILAWTIRNQEEQKKAMRWANNVIFEGFQAN